MKMKTSELIELLCDAVNAVCETSDLVVNIAPDEDGRYLHDNGQLWTAAHSLLSAPCSVFRTLWDELPENLRTDEQDDMVRKLYPHKYESEGYRGLKTLSQDLHAVVFALWQQMNDAKEKYNF